MDIQCQNCGAIYETEYPLHGTITTLVECAICDRDEDKEEEPKIKKFTKAIPGQKLPKKLPATQLYDSGVKKKINKQVIEFLRNNCLTKGDDMLVTSLKDRFGINTTVHTVKWWMSQNGISRRRMQKEAEDHGLKFDDEKELPKLPPEENF